MDEFPHINLEHNVLKRNVQFKFNPERCRKAGFEITPNAEKYEVVKLRRVYHFNKDTPDHIVLTIPKPVFVLVDKDQIPEEDNLKINNHGESTIQQKSTHVKSTKTLRSDHFPYYCSDEEVIIEKCVPEINIELNTYKKQLIPLNNVTESFSDVSYPKSRRSRDDLYETPWSSDPDMIISKCDSIKSVEPPTPEVNIEIEGNQSDALSIFEEFSNNEINAKNYNNLGFPSKMFEPSEDDEILWSELYQFTTKRVLNEEFIENDSILFDQVEKEMRKIHGEYITHEHSYFQRVEEPIDEVFEIPPLAIEEENDEELSSEIRKFIIAQEHSYGVIRKEDHVNGRNLNSQDQESVVKYSSKEEARNAQELNIQENNLTNSLILGYFEEPTNQHNLDKTFKHSSVQKNLNFSGNSSLHEAITEKQSPQSVILPMPVLHFFSPKKSQHIQNNPMALEANTQPILAKTITKGSLDLKQPFLDYPIAKEAQILPSFDPITKEHEIVKQLIQDQLVEQAHIFEEPVTAESITDVESLREPLQFDESEDKFVEELITTEPEMLKEPIDAVSSTGVEGLRASLQNGQNLDQLEDSEDKFEEELITTEPEMLKVPIEADPITNPEGFKTSQQDCLNLDPLEDTIAEELKATEPEMLKISIRDSPNTKECQNLYQSKESVDKTIKGSSEAIPIPRKLEIFKEPIQSGPITKDCPDLNVEEPIKAVTIPRNSEILKESIQDSPITEENQNLDESSKDPQDEALKEPFQDGSVTKEYQKLDELSQESEHKIVEEPINDITIVAHPGTLSKPIQDSPITKKCENLDRLAQESENKMIEEPIKAITIVADPGTVRHPIQDYFSTKTCQNFDELSQETENKLVKASIEGVITASDPTMLTEPIEDGPNTKVHQSLGLLTHESEDKMVEELIKPAHIATESQLLRQPLQIGPIIKVRPDLHQLSQESEDKLVEAPIEGVIIASDPKTLTEPIQDCPNIKVHRSLGQLSHESEEKMVEEPMKAARITTESQLSRQPLIIKVRPDLHQLSQESEDKLVEEPIKGVTIAPGPGTLTEPIEDSPYTKVLQSASHESEDKLVEEPIEGVTIAPDRGTMTEPIQDCPNIKVHQSLGQLSPESEEKLVETVRITTNLKERVEAGPITKVCHNLDHLSQESEDKLVEEPIKTVTIAPDHGTLRQPIQEFPNTKTGHNLDQVEPVSLQQPTETVIVLEEPINANFITTEPEILSKSLQDDPISKECQKFEEPESVQQPIEIRPIQEHEIMTQQIQSEPIEKEEPIQNGHLEFLKDSKVLGNPLLDDCVERGSNILGKPFQLSPDEDVKKSPIIIIQNFLVNKPFLNSNKRKPKIYQNFCVRKRQKNTQNFSFHNHHTLQNSLSNDLAKEPISPFVHTTGSIPEVPISNQIKQDPNKFTSSCVKVAPKIREYNRLNEPIAKLSNDLEPKQLITSDKKVPRVILKRLKIKANKLIDQNLINPKSNHECLEKNPRITEHIPGDGRTMEDSPKNIFDTVLKIQEKNLPQFGIKNPLDLIMVKPTDGTVQSSSAQNLFETKLNILDVKQPENIIKQSDYDDIFGDHAYCVLPPTNFPNREMDEILKSSANKDPLEEEMLRIHEENGTPVGFINQNLIFKEPMPKKPRMDNPDDSELYFKGYTQEEQNEDIKTGHVICVKLIMDLEANIANTLKDLKRLKKVMKRFKCNRCDFGTNKPNHMKMHARVHIQPFWCNLCLANFPKIADLDDHINSYHSNKHKIIKPRKSLLLNNRKISNKAYKCGFCNYSSPYMKRLQHHMVVHEKEKIYNCDKCNYTTLTGWIMERHKKEHVEDEEQYECEDCGFITMYRKQLDEHMQIHSGQKLYKCETCMFSTAHLGYYKAHLSFHETKLENPLENDHEFSIRQPEMIYTCGVCEHISRSRESYYKHVRSSHGNKIHVYVTSNRSDKKIYLCVLCGFWEQSKAIFNNHLMIHLDIKPNKCKICDFLTDNEYNLKIHEVNVHANAKIFSCPSCDKKYSTIRAFKTHINNVHKDINM